LLTAAFYAAVAAYAIHAIWVRIARVRRLPRAPRWLPWIAGLLGAGALALVATARGPMTLFDEASLTSPAIRCLADAERDGAVQDGLATPWLARYWNAARDSPTWRSPYAVVEVGAVTPPFLDPCLNNLLWLNDGYRGGRAKLNFIATFGVPAPILADWRKL